MRVLIVVTHLLGTGHLRRAMMLARGFADAGHVVHLASGGTPVTGLDSDGIDLIQLPPLKSDGTRFTTLLTGDGAPADDTYLENRRSALMEALASCDPDVLITELYPFGRRVLAPEFNALLAAAHDRPRPPVIVCSIRDILAPPSKPAKADTTDALIARYYDGVLVHSDADATPLSVSWPVSDRLAAKLRYTGFVAPPPPVPHPRGAGTGEVLVSAGGGAVGLPVFRTAKAAAHLTPDLTWRVLVGGSDPGPALDDLRRDAPANLTVEAARPDFRSMLCHAACSVSLAGYNTAMDLLQTGCPALLVPFDDGGEVEQGLRALTLARLPAIDVLNSADLTPERMAARVSRLSKLPRRMTGTVAMDGSGQTVRIMEQMWEDQR